MRRHVRALFAISALGSLFAFTGSASAAECPNEAIRIAQGATHLPDCRAYERVSPADSSGGVVGVNTKNLPLFAAIRADGDAASFGSSGAVGETERGSGLATSSLAHRTADGWASFHVLTTTEPGVLMDSPTIPNAPTPSSDMSRIMFKIPRSLGPPNPLAGGGSIYLSAPAGKGAPTWLSRRTFESTQPASGQQFSLPLGGSPDFSSGYFRYGAPLTDLAGDNLRTSSNGIYHFEGETIAPAGVLPSGAVSPKGALPAGTGKSVSSNGLGTILSELARNQVSADGSKLFFASPSEGPEPKQLYVQEGASPGRLISRDTLGSAAPSGIADLGGNPAQTASNGFAYATPDGSRVIFRSESALTGDAPESGVKTYRAAITPNAITLTYLPAVDGRVLKIDDDASTILFSTSGSVAGTTSYYAWDEDRPAAPYAVATDVSGSNQMPESVFSDDGDVLIFTSGAEVEPGIAPPAESGYTQIYRWTKQGGTPVCISCRRDGDTPARFGAHLANSPSIFTDNPAYPTGANPDPANQSTVVNNRKISSDGSRVFFDTSDPLDPVRDLNNTRDVYMWENGKNYLLTSGRNPVPSLILDSSEQGNDVMFVTKDGLIPSDTNQTYDVYNLRVNGGFVEPVTEGCEGDACQGQGQGSGSRPAAAPGSGMLAWAGSKKESRKGKARSRKALATTQLGRPGPNSARVRIQVPSAGKVSIAGADVKAKSRQVKRRGAVVISVGLSPQGKQKLARKGQLKATVKVRFRPKSGAVTRKTMKLSYAGPKGGHR